MENIIPWTAGSVTPFFSALTTDALFTLCTTGLRRCPIIQELVGTKAVHVSSICPLSLLLLSSRLPPLPPSFPVSQRACFGIICDTAVGILHLLISRKAARSERLPPVSHGGKRVVTEFLACKTRSCTRSVASLLLLCHMPSLSLSLERERASERVRERKRRKGDRQTDRSREREKEIARRECITSVRKKVRRYL